MRIIVSPAKKMKSDPDSFPVSALPMLLHKTRELLSTMKGMPPEELKRVWKCSEAIAALNIERLQTMSLESQLTPAILSYEGIQYRYMAPGVFCDKEFAYIQQHLRILSGFYGILKPFDGVTPYRLEMEAKLKIREWDNLYGFWGALIANTLFEETDCIINLASKEYSRCIRSHLPGNIRFITCRFAELEDGRLLEVGTLCKMARGEMVRFMAENQITDPEELKCFDRFRYRFDPKRSNQKTFVFLREPKEEGKHLP